MTMTYWRAYGLCSVPPGWHAVYAHTPERGTNLDDISDDDLVFFDPVMALSLAAEWEGAENRYFDDPPPDEWNAEFKTVPITCAGSSPTYDEGEDSFLGYAAPGQTKTMWRARAKRHVIEEWASLDRRDAIWKKAAEDARASRPADPPKGHGAAKTYMHMYQRTKERIADERAVEAEHS